MDPKLLEILVCPVTKGAAALRPAAPGTGIDSGRPGLSDPRRHSDPARKRGATPRRGGAELRVTAAPGLYRTDSGAPGLDPAARKAIGRYRRPADDRAGGAARRGQRRRSRRVCADSTRVIEACRLHDVEAILTGEHHATGTDRLAEASRLLGLPSDGIVVNVQGDEPLIPPAIIRRVAAALMADREADLATAAHRLESVAEFFDPNVVKVVCDARSRALLFSRAPIPWSRDGFTGAMALGQRPDRLPDDLPALRHVGLYAYRVAFLLRFPALARPPLEQHENLEQLRALFHGSAISVVTLEGALPPGVDTLADLERARQLLAAGAPLGLEDPAAPAPGPR